MFITYFDYMFSIVGLALCLCLCSYSAYQSINVINPYTLDLYEIVEKPTTSLHSLQRSKSSMRIMTNQLSIKVLYFKHWLNLWYYGSLHIKGKDPKTVFQLRQQVAREDSKSLPNQGVKMRTSTFKKATK